MLTRRAILKQAGKTAAVVTTTAPWWLSRRAHAARSAKLVVWNPAALAPQVDKIMQEQCYAYAKQAGIKESEIDYQIIGGPQLLPKVVAALEAGNPPDITRFGGGYAQLYRSQGHLLEVTDLVNKMQKQQGGLFPISAAERHASGQGVGGAAVRQPLAAGHPHGSPGGGQGRAPQDVGRVHRGLQEAAEAAQAHRLRPLPGSAERHRQQRDEHDLGLRRQARRGGQQDRRAALQGHDRRRPADRGHVQQAQDHPEGRDRVGQHRQQQGLPVTPGGLRPESDQHLRPPGGLRQGAVQRHGAAAGAGGAGWRHRGAHDGGLAALQAQSLSRGGQGARRVLDGPGKPARS